MPRCARVAVVLVALASPAVLAQTVVTPAVDVQRLAPQLVTLAGSPANFQNLVSGLAPGTPVQLLSPVEIAQRLEAARQSLIGLGIATPTGEQLAFALMGGVVPTALGGIPVNRALSPAAQIQSQMPTTQLRVNTSDSLLVPGATSRSPTPRPRH